ncbi:hypothetical protein RN001_003850 [Aquatica leii]|uniref:Lipase domain-containing protein n=1 Tax=Aquatica leii TaxID=1421715 RepID=A0AAN7SMI6_9COLE|nr:hypothetical protein RN001_003850 [Aquatica leii]
MNRKTIILLLLGVITVYGHDGMTIKELEKETTEELKKITTNKDIVANCENHPRPQKPKYVLYNRNNPNEPIFISPSNLDEIKKEKKTFFFIPGWLTTPTTSTVLSLKDAYLERYDCNFLIVDWSQNIFKPYSYVYCDVKTVSMDVSDFLCALNRELQIELKDVHVIGHSFGGHIAGFVGTYVDLECGQKIGRISGLDASGPLYKFRPEDERLSEKDALFVDDSCKTIKNITDTTLVSDIFCPSMLSIKLFAESVNSNQLIAVSCGLCSRLCKPDIVTEVYTVMGEDCREEPGFGYTDNFLIYIRDSEPYGICYDGMEVRDLEKETANELKLILRNRDLTANCTNHPKPSKPKYVLFNKEHAEIPIELSPSNLNEIKVERHTIIIIPGWLTYINNSKIMELKDAYFQRYDCNFIVVDWSKYAFVPYTSAYCDVKTHAINIADFLCALQEQSPNVQLADMHVIGHSLGAQIAGFAGKYTDLECDKKIGRITGLDPAGPLYNYKPNEDKLSKEDALFVDIIHSNYQFGALKPSGDVDFHVNCVYDQPGCVPITEVTEETLISDCYCPSVRSIELMAESVNSNQLIAVSCSRCTTVCEPDIITEVYAIMGEDCRETPEDADNFLIYTNEYPPYGAVTGRAEDRTLINFAGNLLHDVLNIATNTVLGISGKCSNPKIDNINLYLYTRNASKNPIALNFIEPRQVNTDKKVMVLIHGYISSAQNHKLLDIKNAYLEKYDCNVIMVNWSKYAWTSYSSVVCVLPKIAKLLGYFLCTLSKGKLYKLKNIHLVGHSLGAQMAGLIGQTVKVQCEQVIGRITGLDPAGPLYLDTHIDERLDSSDAEFVDVIHTNGGVFGYLTNTGHADFYPNCGTIQFCKVFLYNLEEMVKLPLYLSRPEERTLLNFAGNLLRDVLKITTNTVLKVSEKCSNPTIDNIKLYLYTRNASENPIVVNFIEPSKVNTEKKIIILIHGYISKAQNHELLDIKNAYLEKYDCNVIMVDWSEYAWTSYPSVVCILPKIANLLGNFLCTLSKQKQYKLKNIHLVGHSLGAQMSGLIGQAVKAECQQVIGRITGLDPAGPLYLDTHIDERLDATDAEFVDIIHTNGGIFGYLTNTGHADFYPNCGTIQFCKVFPIALEEILKLPFLGFAKNVHDPKLSDLDRGIVQEIFLILTKGVLKLGGECAEPIPENVTLYLYTRTTMQDPIELDYLNPYQVDTSKKVIVLIHGYVSGALTPGLQDLKKAYLERYDCNVIMVHWSTYGWGLYTNAVCMVPKIANLLGEFLCRLSEQNDYSLEKIHLVGHSLGAQMSGLTGQAVKEQCQQTIGRITGLDPAGPLFISRPIDERLDTSDANFVDIIHTNGGVFGYLTSIGHVDFYPNCGILQFCKAFQLSLSGILDLPLSVVTCHHSVSLDYMSEAVRTNNFKGIPCKGCPLLTCPPILSIFKKDRPTMGEQCHNTTRGNYFVAVNTREPFAIV